MEVARLVLGRRKRCAVVKRHGDVRAQRELHVHGVLRRQAHFGTVNRRAKLHTVFGDLAQSRQAEYLKTARVSENRMLPVHELVQATVNRNHRSSRPQHEVKSVAEQYLRPERRELLGRHCLYGAVGTDRHEGRRIKAAVRA